MDSYDFESNIKVVCDKILNKIVIEIMTKGSDCSSRTKAAVE